MQQKKEETEPDIAKLETRGHIQTGKLFNVNKLFEEGVIFFRSNCKK